MEPQSEVKEKNVIKERKIRLSLDKVKVNISHKTNKLLVRGRKIEVQSLGKVN